MILRIWCWLFGHIFLSHRDEPLGNAWVRKEYWAKACLRCGTKFDLPGGYR